MFDVNVYMYVDKSCCGQHVCVRDSVGRLCIYSRPAAATAMVETMITVVVVMDGIEI